jgi:hypothetical protein
VFRYLDNYLSSRLHVYANFLGAALALWTMQDR